MLGVALTPRGPTYRLSDPHKMKAAILKHVPPGTTIEDAKAFMQQEGFQCEREYTNQMFTGDGETHQGLDFTYCERSQSEGLLEVRIWGVALVVADGKITEVFVRSGVFGL